MGCLSKTLDNIQCYTIHNCVDVCDMLLVNRVFIWMTQVVKILKLLQCYQNLLNGQCSETEKSQSCLEVVMKFHDSNVYCF